MSRSDLSQVDISTRQQAVLDTVLRANTKVASVRRVSVADAKSQESLYESNSRRESVRLLFISRDTTLLNQTQQSLDGYLQLSEVFDEVHIVILRPGIQAKTPVLRVAPNVWIYIATAKRWWQTPFAAMRMISEQLVFAEGFRPDLIVARDPFECALVAFVAGQLYDRPTQVHITEDFLSDQFKKSTPYAQWRTRIARYVLPRFKSVRTTTNQMQEKIAQLYPIIPDVNTLPRFNSYEQYVDAPVKINIKEKYRSFSYIFIYFGALTHRSTLPVVLEAIKGILSNPRVGLVVVGDGPYRDDVMRKAKALKIADQVVFEKATDDFMGYLKTADTLIVSDTDALSDEIVIRGAVVGAPIVCTSTPLREDLFISGESALISELQVDHLTTYLSAIMDDFDGRQRLRYVARAAVTSRLLQDRAQYQYMFRASVEEGLFAGMEMEASVLETAAVTP